MLVLIIIAIVIIGAGAAGVLLTAPSGKTSSKSSSSVVTSSSAISSSAAPFTINYDELTVGYQGGLYQLGFQSAETKQLSGVVVVLNTPVQAVMCTGFGSLALGFGNCIAGPDKTYDFTPSPAGSFAANATFTGYDTGAGPGSAVVGQNYTVTITGTYADGTTSNMTVSVQAVAGN